MNILFFLLFLGGQLRWRTLTFVSVSSCSSSYSSAQKIIPSGLSYVLGLCGLDRIYDMCCATRFPECSDDRKNLMCQASPAELEILHETSSAAILRKTKKIPDVGDPSPLLNVPR